MRSVTSLSHNSRDKGTFKEALTQLTIKNVEKLNAVPQYTKIASPNNQRLKQGGSKFSS